MLTHAGWAKGVLAGVVLAAAGAGLQAAPPPAAAFPSTSPVLRASSMDDHDAMRQYLTPARGPKGLDAATLSVVTSGRPANAVYNAPALFAREVGSTQGVATYASLVYPQVTGLAGMALDERSVPLTETSNLLMGPGGVGQVMMGRSGDLNHASETAISYIRPHLNVQMMFALEAPGTPEAGSFEGAGVSPRAYMTIDHQTKVDSTEIGKATQHFGNYQAPPPVDEQQTSVSAGLDLGLMPTFLSQMGMNVSIVASRGRQSGNVSVAVVGTTELPVDWSPREHLKDHKFGSMMEENGGPVGYTGPSAGDIAQTNGPASAQGQATAQQQLVPIAPEGPTTPEPATLTLLAAGAVIALVRRRK
jgi:PEP-CTERM motif